MFMHVENHGPILSSFTPTPVHRPTVGRRGFKVSKLRVIRVSYLNVCGTACTSRRVKMRVALTCFYMSPFLKMCHPSGRELCPDIYFMA